MKQVSIWSRRGLDHCGVEKHSECRAVKDSLVLSPYLLRSPKFGATYPQGAALCLPPPPPVRSLLVHTSFAPPRHAPFHNTVARTPGGSHLVGIRLAQSLQGLRGARSHPLQYSVPGNQQGASGQRWERQPAAGLETHDNQTI